MKVRKLAVALALAGGLGSSVAQALGLGEIELQSYLNEPLDAKIVLSQSRGVDPGDVFVNIAPESAYERVGLSRNQFLSKLRFKVITASDGRLAVDVSSREPLKEPYLNFLLELTWPNGRLMREYAVLVDPPVYAEGSGVQEQVAAPSVTSGGSAATNTVATREPVRRSGSGGGYQGNTFGPTGASDTLWTIASRVRPDNSVSMQQVMLALQDLNPDAFVDGNINRLKRGQVLRVPSLDQIQSRTRAQAVQAVAQQNQEFQSPEPERVVDATADTGPVSAAPAAVAAGGDELKLLVADSSSEASETGSAGGDGKLPGGVDAGTAVALEELESARRENEELNNRVDDLQGQVETLKRLLELKNSELADLQQMVSSDSDETLPAPGFESGADMAPGTDDMAGELGTEGGAEGLETGDPGFGESGATMAEDSVMEGAEAGAFPEPGMGEDPLAGMDDASSVEPEPAGPVPEADGAESSTAQAPAAPVRPEPKPAPVADKGFPGNIIDAITSNVMYQVALGGGLVLLLLVLLLVARRNANREKAFYEQLEGESDEGDDAFDLDLDDGDAGAVADPLAEADSLVSYGRHDQAAEVLETAISREPSRTDLRLKLLGVYADTEDRDSFEKQFGEIQALEDEEALASALEMRARLEEAESIPSIDDLESQLRSDSFRAPQAEDESLTAAPAGVQEESSEAGLGDETVLEKSALSDELLSDQFDSLPGEDLPGVGPEEEPEQEEDDLGVIEYDVSDLSLDSGEDETVSGSEKADESLFDIKLDESAEAGADSDDLSLDFSLDEAETAAESGAAEVLSEDALGALDESFLDELDAELDKVVADDEDTDAAEDEESLLGDLELDISDEDINLMEELSETVPAPGADEPDDSAEVDLADLEDLEDLSSLEGLDSVTDSAEAEQEDELDLDIDDLPVASEEVAEESVASSSVADLEESDLGDDDDFDFLAGADEAATKLDLARAYIEMGDHEGARDILDEVAIEGNEEQKTEARELLKNIS